MKNDSPRQGRGAPPTSYQDWYEAWLQAWYNIGWTYWMDETGSSIADFLKKVGYPFGI